MLAALLRELPTQRRRLIVAVGLLVLEALLSTTSIAMLVPIGQAVADDQAALDLAGISLDWLPEVFLSGDSRIVWLLVLVGLLVAVKVLAGLGKELLAARISRDVWADWVGALTSGYLALPFREQAGEDSGVVINLAAREANRASNIIIIYLGWLTSVITFLAVVAAMVVVEWRVVAAVALVSLLAYVFVLRPLMRRSRSLGQRSVIANQDLTTLVSQTIQGVKDVVLLNLQRPRSVLVSRAARHAAGLDFRYSVLRAIPPYGIELIFAAGILGLAAMLTLTGPADRAEWLPLVLFFTAATFRLATQASTLTSTRMKISNRYPSFEKLAARVARQPGVSPDQEGRELKRLNGPVQVRDLRFFFDDVQILDAITVDIAPDQVTFLVGPSGSGKSTFIDVLARLYLPHGGAVLTDGVDYREYHLADWRRCLAYVSQTPVLFSGTVRENVTAGDDRIDDVAVAQALSLAGADRFVAALPAGLDTPLGERGHGISGGQLCRLAIARALVREPSLLMLDESTSGIEPQLERAILSELRAIPGIGVLVVSHRRDNIDLADVVLEMDRGRIEAPAPLARSDADV